MPLFGVAFNSAPIDGGVANGVQTSVAAFCDGKEYRTDTHAATVRQALEDTPCKLEGNDIAEPSADTRLEGGNVSVAVTKATQVMVVDGGKTIFGKTTHKNARDILRQLGIEVHPEDKVRADLIISDFLENGLGQKITIERTPAITLEADGNILVVRSNAKTVGELLKEKGIVLGASDELAPTVDTAVTTGMKITLVRIKTEDVVENQVVPFGTVNKKDYNLYQGQGAVESEGINGEKTVTYRVIYRNGVVASKTPVLEQLVRAPKDRVVLAGAKPYGAGDLWSIMVEAGAKYGVDPGAMYRVMMCESGGRVNAVSRAGYRGLFQWDGSFYNWAAKAGVPADYFNPRSQIFATAARVSASGGWRAWGCKP